jgi:CheY-like chemotaxis protein
MSRLPPKTAAYRALAAQPWLTWARMSLVLPSILLVEDDDDVREALDETLQAEGFLVASVANGSKAIEWLRAHRTTFCVVLLDLMMPVMDGKAFLTVRRTDDFLSTIPVVVITASGGRSEIAHGHGVAACISKPIDLPSLLGAIQSCAPSKRVVPAA